MNWDTRVLKSGDVWCTEPWDDDWWYAEVVRVAKDGSWADLNISYALGGGPLAAWSKRQPLGPSGIPEWFEKYGMTYHAEVEW